MKKTIKGILLSLIIVLMAGIVNAAYDCDMMSTATTSGTSNTYKRGLANISANVTGRNSAVNAYNLTTAEISINTGTISGALLQNDTTAPIGNVSDFDDLNFTVDTSQLKDDTTYTLTITLKNETQQTEGTCTLSIITDNTVPAYSAYSPAEGTVDSDGTVDFSVTCSNTSSATLHVEDLFYSMTESSDVCTATVSDLRNSLQSWYIKGSDGLNTTTSTTTKVEIRRSGGASVQGGQLIIGAGQPSAQPQKGIKGFIDFLISIPGMILRPIFNFINSLMK